MASKRSKKPSPAVVVGAAAGVPVGQIVVQAAQELGADIGPGTAALAATLISTVFAYFAKGGRAGDQS